MAKSISLLIISFVLVFTLTQETWAEDVNTSGSFPLKRGSYTTLKTSGDTVLAATDETVSIGTPIDSAGSKLTVVGDEVRSQVRIQGSLEAQDTLQIQICSGCVIPPNLDNVGRLYLDTSVIENHRDVTS